VKWIILLPTIIIFSAIAAAILFQVINGGGGIPTPLPVPDIIPPSVDGGG
jgi:hypothetical protein